MSIKQNTNQPRSLETGSIAVAHIASHLLTDPTKAILQGLLDDTEPSYLGTIATINYNRDRHDERLGIGYCLIGGLANYTEQLFDTNPDKPQRAEAAKFVVNSMGKVHQALDTGFEDDKGDNTVSVHWYRRKTNLHHVCDHVLIQTAIVYKYNNIAESWSNNFTKEIEGQKQDWLSDMESIRHALWQSLSRKKTSVFHTATIDSIHKDVEQDSRLGDEYYFTKYPVLKKQVARAGYRLAALVNGLSE